MAGIFDQVEDAADAGVKTKSSWTGVLSLQLPALGLTQEYHLRLGKAKGNQEKVEVVHVDKSNGRVCEAKEVERFYRYTEVNGSRSDPVEVSYEELKERVRYQGEGGPWFISGRREKRYFDSEMLAKGSWVEVNAADVQDQQQGQEVSPFERTQRMEVGPEDYIPLARVPEYAVKELYQLSPNGDKKVREQSGRVLNLARSLLEKQVALVTGFVWKQGYSFYTCLVFPYEEPKSGKLWLLMATTEGVRQLDPAWALQDSKPGEKVATARVAPPPKVRLAK